MKMTKWPNVLRSVTGASLFIAAGLMVGCKPDAPPAPPTATASAAAPKVNFGNVPGLPIDPPVANPAQIQSLIAMQSVHPRHDPFSLSPQEMAFDQSQTTERLLQQGGNMETMYVSPPPPDDTPPPVEPQPYRRVSGILVGDSVVAIIEMGDGKPPVIVRPGTEIRWVGLDRSIN